MSYPIAGNVKTHSAKGYSVEHPLVVSGAPECDMFVCCLTRSSCSQRQDLILLSESFQIGKN